jgi:hypothetical protein
MPANEPRLSRPLPAPETPFASHQIRPVQVVERLTYDVWFTDELIRRCHVRAAQGYRLAATCATSNKSEIVLVFEVIEWNGVSFPSGESELSKRS